MSITAWKGCGCRSKTSKMPSMHESLPNLGMPGTEFHCTVLGYDSPPRASMRRDLPTLCFPMTINCGMGKLRLSTCQAVDSYRFGTLRNVALMRPFRRASLLLRKSS